MSLKEGVKHLLVIQTDAIVNVGSVMKAAKDLTVEMLEDVGTRLKPDDYCGNYRSAGETRKKREKRMSSANKLNVFRPR